MEIETKVIGEIKILTNLIKFYAQLEEFEILDKFFLVVEMLENI